MNINDLQNSDRIKSILHDQMEYINSVQQTLRELGVPEAILQQETMVLPEFDKLLPDDVERVFQRVKFLTITYFDEHGFSQREISRRLKGESVRAVNKFLKENKDE